MQLSNLKHGWKPMTVVAASIVAGSSLMYSDFDQYSEVKNVVNDNIVLNHFQNVDSEDHSYMLLRRRFYNYYESWQEETMFLSSVNAIVENANFKAMVAMGHKIVPFVIEEIETAPSPLVWVLNEIFQTKISKNPNSTIQDACKLWVKAIKK